MKKLIVIGALALTIACSDDFYYTPKMIEVDSETYFSCGNLLTMNDGLPYEIKFVDSHGVNHSLKGIKHLHISGLSEDEIKLACPGTK